MDSTVLIDHAQGLPAAVDLVRSLFSEPNDLLICDVVVTEALEGPDDEIAIIGRLIDARVRGDGPGRRTLGGRVPSPWRAYESANGLGCRDRGRRLVIRRHGGHQEPEGLRGPGHPGPHLRLSRPGRRAGASSLHRLHAYWRPRAAGRAAAAEEHTLSVGTAFHPRTEAHNRKMQWREWSGYFAASVYADFHDIEYNAIREQAALIDVSPLYKYEVRGRDALRLVDRVITGTRRSSGSAASHYTPWCDEDGKVVDDGTVHRLAEDRFRWTAADPQYRWLTMNAAGLQVEIEDVSEQLAAVALQDRTAGPSPRAPRASRSRTCATSAGARRRSPARRSTSAGPATPATSATSCGSRPTERSTSGMRSSPPASRTASGRPGWSPSMSSGSRPG